MILHELGDYLAREHRVSRQELARHFHTSEDAIEAMLGVWMRKGRVIKQESQLCGGSCCGKQQLVMFEWCEPGRIGLVQRG